MRPLHNIYSREELRKKRAQETFERKICSFYRYIPIEDPTAFRNALYLAWDEILITGRIYIAKEGINAQISVPEIHWENFKKTLEHFPYLKKMFINEGLTPGNEAFLKLDIKVRQKIVADGMADDIFKLSETGTHLPPIDFHKKLDEQNVTVVDTRNDYECEIGHFKGALLPESENFRDVLGELIEKLQDKKEEPILMYCTGGIRCEKASAFFKHQGFQKVYQLQGGIINYLRETKKQGLKTKFHGSNFVFDGRMAEPIDDQMLGKCITCDSPYNKHIDCANVRCHKLMVQCEDCAKNLKACCSQTCADALQAL